MDLYPGSKFLSYTLDLNDIDESNFPIFILILHRSLVGIILIVWNKVSGYDQSFLFYRRQHSLGISGYAGGPPTFVRIFLPSLPMSRLLFHEAYDTNHKQYLPRIRELL